jgi:hypothetical protein
MLTGDRIGGGDVVVIALCVLIAVLAISSAGAAGPETLSVTLDDHGGVSLEARNASLDRVLVEIAEAVHARVLIETVLGEELTRARVDTSFTHLPVSAAVRRVLTGRHYLLMYGPAGVEEVRIYVDGATGYRELTPPDPVAKTRPTLVPLADWPPDDPAEVARLREAALDARDASARAQALDELSGVRDTKVVLQTLAQVLARERDGRVLRRVFGLAAQQRDRMPPETLRMVIQRDLDGTPRAQAVELLADQAGDDPATRALLRSLAAEDASPEVREAAATALAVLEEPQRTPTDGGRR